MNATPSATIAKEEQRQKQERDGICTAELLLEEHYDSADAATNNSATKPTTAAATTTVVATETRVGCLFVSQRLRVRYDGSEGGEKENGILENLRPDRTKLVDGRLTTGTKGATTHGVRVSHPTNGKCWRSSWNCSLVLLNETRARNEPKY